MNELNVTTFEKFANHGATDGMTEAASPPQQQQPSPAFNTLATHLTTEAITEFSETRRRRRRIVRGKKCRALCNTCFSYSLKNPLGPIVVVAMCIATGAMLAASAAILSADRWHWPLLNTLLALCPLLPLFGCKAANEIERLVSEKDQSFQDDYRDGPLYGFGWFLVGVSITTAFASPILFAQLNIVEMRIVWLSALGSWFLSASIILGVAFVIRAQHPGGNNDNNDDDYND
jgi:hypothetical protein